MTGACCARAACALTSRPASRCSAFRRRSRERRSDLGVTRPAAARRGGGRAAERLLGRRRRWRLGRRRPLALIGAGKGIVAGAGSKGARDRAGADDRRRRAGDRQRCGPRARPGPSRCGPKRAATEAARDVHPAPSTSPHHRRRRPRVSSAGDTVRRARRPRSSRSGGLLRHTPGAARAHAGRRPRAASAVDRPTDRRPVANAPGGEQVTRHPRQAHRDPGSPAGGRAVITGGLDGQPWTRRGRAARRAGADRDGRLPGGTRRGRRTNQASARTPRDPRRSRTGARGVSPRSRPLSTPSARPTTLAGRVLRVRREHGQRQKRRHDDNAATGRARDDDRGESRVPTSPREGDARPKQQLRRPRTPTPTTATQGDDGRGRRRSARATTDDGDSRLRKVGLTAALRITRPSGAPGAACSATGIFEIPVQIVADAAPPARPSSRGSCLEDRRLMREHVARSRQ